MRVRWSHPAGRAQTGIQPKSAQNTCYFSNNGRWSKIGVSKITKKLSQKMIKMGVSKITEKLSQKKLFYLKWKVAENGCIKNNQKIDTKKNC